MKITSLTIADRSPEDSQPKAKPVPARRNMAAIIQGQGLLVMLVGLIIAFTVSSGNFLTVDNFLNIGSSAAALGIMAVAQTFLIVSGGFDVSVGSVVAMTTVIIGLGVNDGLSIWVSTVLALLAAMLIGAVNGSIVVWLKVNPLITTLGTMSIFSGLAFIISNGRTLVITDSAFINLGLGKLWGVPIPLLIFCAAFLCGIVVERLLSVGRAIYAIGSNAEAARLAGIRVKQVPFVLYVVSSLSAGIAGVIVTGQLASASPQVGQSYLLSVVTAVILGGASLAGGRGSVLGTLVAVAILGVLQSGFSLLSLSSYVQTVALGGALILAVLIDQASRAVTN
jgi:ribose transport system permease protein